METERQGMAYSFFYSSAPKEEIERELPSARRIARTPNNLELVLRDTVSYVFNDTELRKLKSKAEAQGNNYMLIATLKEATNRKTAQELGDIQNALYQSPLQETFQTPEGKYIGGIVYQEKNTWEFLE